MRLAALLLVLAACGAKASTGPAWPKTADKEQDGGESLEPRGAAKEIAAAAAEKPDEDETDKKPTPSADKPAAAADTKSETPKPATDTPRAPDDIIITTEEIVIEIDDD